MLVSDTSPRCLSGFTQMHKMAICRGNEGDGVEISQPPRRERSHVCPVMVSLCSARVQGGERGQRSARGVCFVAKAVRRPASQMYRCADSNASINLRPSVVVVVAQQSEGGGGSTGQHVCIQTSAAYTRHRVYSMCA